MSSECTVMYADMKIYLRPKITQNDGNAVSVNISNGGAILWRLRFLRGSRSSLMAVRLNANHRLSCIAI